MNDDRKDLPTVDSPNFLARVRETLQTYIGSQGDPLKRGVVLGDLTDAGIVALRPGYKGGKNPIAGIGDKIASGAVGPPGPPGPAVPYEPDLSPPPTPTGFTAVAAISNILLEHANPTYTQGHGHARTRVYGATWSSGALPTFSDAVEITQFSGTVFAYATNPATTWHLWIKWETVDGVLSAAPSGGINGVAVTTGQDVSKLVTAMTGAGKPFTVLNVPTTIGGVTFPAGIYSTNAFIQDAQITNAKIANLAVDNAKIASMSVAKLTAGAVAVGQYIQSTGFVPGSAGWRINGDGTAELANAVVRGAIYASSGTFTGTVNASTVNSPTINGGTVNAATVNSSTVNGGTINSVTFNGINMNSGTLNIQGDGGSGYGYARSYGKWFADGVNGWVFARAPSDGSTFAEIKAGAGRLWFASWGDYGLEMPGIRMTAGGLTISQLNVINTAQIAGNAVSVMNSASGTGATISTTLYIPPNETMRIVGMGYWVGVAPYSTTPISATYVLSVDGAADSSLCGVTANQEGGDSGSLLWGQAGGCLVKRMEIAGGTGGRTIVVSLTKGAGIGGSVIALGTLR